MLYRFTECYIEDHTQPAVEVWLNAQNERQAQKKCAAFLSLTWDVDASRIGFGGCRSERELLLDAVEDIEAGDRRLVAGGSVGNLPLYSASPVIWFLDYRKQCRLLAAYSAARSHARELAALFDKRAFQAKARGDRHFETLAWQARQYWHFATSDFTTALE